MSATDRIRSRLRRLLSPRVGSATVFTTSSEYWENRYSSNGNSGPGSYDRLATFKADYLNALVRRMGIRSVLELGSGDGAQLSLASYPEYLGLDVSATAIALCRARFASDPTKRFLHIGEVGDEVLLADLALSLDVIYHLVEDSVFEAHLRSLFANATRAVVIYSSDRDETWPARHVRHRRFTSWVAENVPGWRLVEIARNPYPFDPGDPRRTSFADIHLYEPC